MMFNTMLYQMFFMHHQKYQRAENSSGIPAGVYSTGLTYTNGDWHIYCKKCGVNKTHASILHAYFQKEVASFELPPTHPFSLNLTEKCDGVNKKSSVFTNTPVTTTITVKSYLDNISNKELIIKTQAIFEYFPRTNQYPYLEYAVYKLSGVSYLNQRVVVYVSGVNMVPKC